MKNNKLTRPCPLCNHRGSVELDNKTGLLKLKCRTCGLIKMFPPENVPAK